MRTTYQPVAQKNEGHCFRTFEPARPRSGSRRLPLRTAVCLLLCALPPGSRADQQPAVPAESGPEALKRLSLEELSQIEVTSPAKEPQRAFRVPMAIYVITGEEIRRSGATNIPTALRLAPGVEVARIDGNKWSIGIRGFGSRLSRSVLVLMDGRTVYTTFFAGTYWEVQDTVMDDVDRIEVIRGPGGTIWGPNAVDGVINIITKNTKETHGLLASTGSGNEEQGFASFRYGGGNGKNFDYRVYGKGFTRGPEVHADGRNFDDWRAAQTGFRMDWKRQERETVTIQGDLYREEAGERVTATSYTPPFTQDIDGNAHLSGGNILARWTKDLSNGDNIQVQAYYDRTNRSEPNFAETRNTFDVDLLHRIRLAKRHQILWGLGARFSLGNAPPVVSGLTFDPQERTDQLYTAFLQDEISIVEQRLSLTLGTKVLRTNFTGFELEPSARLAWTPSDKQTIWAAFTHSVRTPSRAEEDFFLSGYIGTTASGVPFFARFNANRNFAPEQLNGYELGYRRLMRRNLYLDLATFFNHYHDLFSEDITGPAFLEATPAPAHFLLPAQFRNDLLGATTGMEISPEWRPASFWRLRGSYSFLHIDLKKAPNTLELGTSPIIEGSSPQHQGSIQTNIDLSKRFELDLTYRYVSSLPSQSVPAYSTGDARLGWHVTRQFEVSLVGRNLFQPWHFEYQGDPGPLVGIKRSAYVKLTWTQ
jgi:iron complex outermembrane receptor protein